MNPSTSSKDGEKPAGLANMPLQKFTKFSSLPPEIRLRIWEEADPPRTIKFESAFSGFFSSGMSNYHLPAIDRVNFEARTVAKRRRLIVESLYNGSYRMDPKKDLFRTLHMVLPSIVPTTVWPLPGMSPDALPLRRLQSTGQLGELLDDEDLDVLRRTVVDGSLDLSFLPVLEEWTMVGKDWYEPFWLDGYQVHYPEIVNRSEIDCLFEFVRGDGEFVKQAAPYFDKKGLIGYAGIRWPPCQTEEREYAYPVRIGTDWQDGASRHLEENPSFNENHGTFDQFEFWNMLRPYVGLMGYSIGATSCGGHWAGFLYYVETKKVYFTPLAWYEVKDALTSEHYPLDSFHDMVARVFIVHPGQEAPKAPHYAWEEIKSFEPHESQDMKKIRTIWLIMRDIFNMQWFRFERMRLDP